MTHKEFLRSQGSALNMLRENGLLNQDESEHCARSQILIRPLGGC